MDWNLDTLQTALSELLAWAPLLRAAFPLVVIALSLFALMRWLGHVAERVRVGQGPWRSVALKLLPWLRGLAVLVAVALAARTLTVARAWFPVVALSIILLIGLATGGLALMRDVLMGLIISIQRPFRVGDQIRIGKAPTLHEGEVRSIGLRSTLLVSLDGTRSYVPNSQVIGHVIVNRTPLQGIFPVLIRLPIPPTASLDTTRRLAIRAAWSSRFASPYRAPEVTLDPDAPPQQPTLLVHAFTPAASLEGLLRTDITELFLEALSPPASILTSSTKNPTRSA